MKNKVLGVWKKTQPYRRPFLVLVAIYTIAIVAILRANITYLEDTRRTIEGNKWADIGDFGRFGADFLLTLLGANSTLHDISPLPQLFAIILLAISSIIIVRILSSGKKVRYLPLLASIPIALSPFFCRALLYKFDSVSMAASILFSVLPFLWHKDTKKFAIASVLGTIGMCITYQGSSGVFIIIALALSFREFLFDDKKLKDIARFLGVAAVAFLIGLIVFQFAILPLANLGYRSTEMLSISDFVPGVIRNTRTYFAAIWYGLGDLWRFGMIAMFLCFVAVTTICAKNK